GAAQGRTVIRPLRFGDKVEKEQILAVVWSKDLGEKKSELVAGLSQLRLDEDNLKNMELYRASLPERSLREAQAKVKADVIAVEKARHTLRSWRLTEEEIKAIEEE